MTQELKKELYDRNKRPKRCRECKFFKRKLGETRYGEPIGECERPYPPDAGKYTPSENYPPLLLCNGVKRE